MASSSMSTALVPVRSGDLSVGQPVPRSIYSDEGDLLLARGTVIETEAQLAGLLERGLFRNAKWGTEPDTDSRPLPESHDVIKARLQAKMPRPAAPARGEQSVVGMDQVRWQIGDSLTLQMAQLPEQRFQTSLIGSFTGKSILVSAPGKDGQYVHLRDGQELIVRTLSGRRAYVFSTTLLKYQNLPYPYLHLAWPRQVRCTVIRQDARIEVDMDAFLEVDGAAPVPFNLLDISVGGVSIRGKVLNLSKEMSGRLKFVIQVAGERRALDLQVVVRQVMADSDPHQARYGLEFVGLEARERLVLSAFVYQTQSDSL